MSATPETLAPLLLGHFDRMSRDMPWRRTADPYAIWVSEVMLQQTRVDAVIPYYERWLQRFPDVDTLADADDTDVLRAWEGLGYYSRARNLKAAARTVRERHHGRIPDTAEALRDLPGIGDYTAGAVASIAYNRRVPAVDGNARRVFSRLLDLEQPTFKQLQPLVQQFVPAHRPGDFNQAVMELGSTICTPRNPRCLDCPVRTACSAYENDTVALRPGAAPSKTVPQALLATAVLTANDPAGNKRIRVVQRPASGLLAGMWEFPAIPSAASRTARTARDAAHKIARRVGSALSRRARRLEPVRHVFSHRIEEYHPFVFDLGIVSNFSGDVEARWVTTTELHDLPLPVAQRRIARQSGFG
jgi:A/G-specific adenine glycosylase